MKSCQNCAYLHAWNFPASVEEPQDRGWDCGYPDINKYSNPNASTDEILDMCAMAQDCPDYLKNESEDSYEPESVDVRPTIKKLPDWEIFALLHSFP